MYCTWYYYLYECTVMYVCNEMHACACISSALNMIYYILLFFNRIQYKVW